MIAIFNICFENFNIILYILTILVKFLKGIFPFLKIIMNKF